MSGQAAKIKENSQGRQATFLDGTGTFFCQSKDRPLILKGSFQNNRKVYVGKSNILTLLVFESDKHTNTVQPTQSGTAHLSGLKRQCVATMKTFTHFPLPTKLLCNHKWRKSKVIEKKKVIVYERDYQDNCGDYLL